MNISPVAMMQANPSFKCAKCEQAPQYPAFDPKDAKEDKVVAYASMGPDYFYPVTASQMKMYEDNIEANRLARENARPLEELQGETLDEYLERHKLEWSM
ncbi:MAG: hypothetical protein IJB79_02975 [Candidatus Gastranaerophilales bacterium]|nr:hypothetical protein [Candidatus Gastranaerophilales bacterium]